MKFISRVTGTVFTVFSFIFAQDIIQLSGSLPEYLTSDKRYLVVADIYVPPGSSVTIDAGVVLLFGSFTGLHVQGTLYVKGEPEKPVVFTTENDSRWNPSSTIDAAPYDWNGIDVYETAIGTNFTRCIIQYSVYGLRSQTEYFKINSSIFRNNGKADLTINGEKKEIASNSAFSYGLPSETVEAVKLPNPEQLILADTTVQSKPVDVIQKKPAKRSSAGIQILRYSSLAVAIAVGAVTSWYYKDSFIGADQKLKDLSELDNDEMLRYTSKDWENAEKERNRMMALCIGGSAGTVICVGVFALSFAF